MKSRKMLLPALLSVVLALIAISPGSVVAQGELQYSLTISSTGGGSVTTPGEGNFTYDEGVVVNVAAEPEEGHRFAGWTGDVWTMSDVNSALATVIMRGNYSITANFVAVPTGNVGVKAGDWIKIEYKTSGWPAGQPYPEWLKLEFLSVEGTSANTGATLHLSDGTEQSYTVPLDAASGGGGTSLGLSGLVIFSNLTTADSLYISGYGDVTIEGETARTYAGAERTVIYASFSQGGAQQTYYWDKQTGVGVEASYVSGGATLTGKATETNMWEATTVGVPWWVWVIVAVAVVAGGVGVYLRRKRTLPGASP
jgi:hypothetical protein